MKFRARSFEYTFPRPTLVMGILNVTPDSFSDGGQNFSLENAVARGLEMEKQGADIIDIGGESTRPGAALVDETEEISRVVPVIAHLVQQLKIPISIDTQKPGVARAAVQAGASIINDIAANRGDTEMWKIVAETGVGYICMHMQGTPQTMQVNPTYNDVVTEVKDFFTDRFNLLLKAGVKAEQIVLDPGIGFGKTLEHNLQLLRNLKEFKSLSRPILLGVSRKSFITKLLGVGIEERLPASLACAAIAIEAGVQLLRVHDVAETVQIARMTENIIGTSVFPV